MGIDNGGKLRDRHAALGGLYLAPSGPQRPAGARLCLCCVLMTPWATELSLKWSSLADLRSLLWGGSHKNITITTHSLQGSVVVHSSPETQVRGH
jgi:hypothetical protein